MPLLSYQLSDAECLCLQSCISLNEQIKNTNSQRVLVFLFAEKRERKTDTNNIDPEKEMLLTKGEIGKGGREKKQGRARRKKVRKRRQLAYVCVCEREREKERETQRDRETQTEIDREKEK